MANEIKVLKRTGKEDMKKVVKGLVGMPKKVKKPVVKEVIKPMVKKPVAIKSVVKPKSANPGSPKDASPTKTNPNVINTSIPKLDGLLNGGIEKGSLTCVWAKQGAQGSEDPFIYQIANSASKAGKVFYFTNENSPDSLSKEMKSLGFKGKVNFIDATGRGTGKLKANPNDADEIIKDLEVIVSKIKNPVIFIDSLSMLMETTGQNTDLLKRLKDLNATVVCLLREGVSQGKFLKVINDVFDNIIKLNAVKDRIFIREYFFVVKAKGDKVKERGYPFKTTKSEGIKIYLPKILITGPFGAGKTSFIHSASEKAVSVDRLGTTIALDHGHMEKDGFSVELFGTPGQQRFDPMLKMLGGESFGVIVVVSSIDPQGFPRALEMMKNAEVYGLPMVVAANKADLRGAVKPEEIKAKMKLKDVDVVPVRAENLTKVQPGLPCQLKIDDIKKVLDSILGSIMK